MLTITEQLIEASQGTLKLSPEVTDTEKKGYEMFDDGAIERETAEFLWGFVRLLKPKHILETGTYTGISSLYMGQALKENDFGDLVTLEIENTHKLRAEELWNKAGVSGQVRCQLIASLDYMDSRVIKSDQVFEYDLLFLDSEPGLRAKEVIQFFPFLRPGGYILIHDLHGHLGQENIVNPDHEHFKFWPWGVLPDEIVNWLKTDQLRVIPLPAPRGTVLYYKPTENDYRIR